MIRTQCDVCRNQYNVDTQMGHDHDCIMGKNSQVEVALEAYTTCVNEGISVPTFENDDELLAWYEHAMDVDRDEGGVL